MLFICTSLYKIFFDLLFNRNLFPFLRVIRKVPVFQCVQLCFILLITYYLNMKSKFSAKNTNCSQSKKTRSANVPQYFVFTEIEIISLVFCIILDVIEYAAAILIMPLAGDLFDVVGILFCIVVFRWIGLFSFMELVPGADVFPVFIITWLIWYFLKKQKNITSKIQHPRMLSLFC